MNTLNLIPKGFNLYKKNLSRFEFESKGVVLWISRLLNGYDTSGVATNSVSSFLQTFDAYAIYSNYPIN